MVFLLDDPQEATGFMQPRPTHPLFVLMMLIGFSISTGQINADDNTRNSARLTPLVKAVDQCRLSVVNLRGRKTVPADPNSIGSKLKQVNGMGTGVVIDSRGYVLTNYHVVQGVKVIEVTTAEREKTTAKLLAHDPVTDLAILKINTKRPLPTIKIGTSSDLMLAEQVTAVGNAYGYEHTVTLGIISALNRTVQVNDEQVYRNLIQTDAAINPGNSGGPLLNMNGEMIGISVAVRIGAQGIAFAIPVNDAVEVAANLMGQLVPGESFHGLSTRTIYVHDKPQLVIQSVDPRSPAAAVGLVSGDRITSVNGRQTINELDFQTSILHSTSAKALRLGIVHSDNQTDNITIKLESSPAAPTAPATLAWGPLGMNLVPMSASEMANRHPNYKQGLRVTSVRAKSPAEAEGIMEGDILVAMHGFKTESLENLAYILQQNEIANQKDFMFYILRDKEPFWGQMRVAKLPTR